MKAKILIIILLLILIDGIIIMGIFHDRVVATRDKGLAVDWNADHKIQGNVDFRYYAAVNMLLESRNDWPAGPAAGRIIWRSDLKQGYIFDGTNWVLYTLNSKTSYWSCDGVGFLPSSNGYVYYYDLGDVDIHITTIAGDESVMASVKLPQGAIVTAVKVYGNNPGTDQWLFVKNPLDNSAVEVEIAGAAINTQVAGLNETIDNSVYGYRINVSVVNGSEVYGARITYTTIYI